MKFSRYGADLSQIQSLFKYKNTKFTPNNMINKIVNNVWMFQ
jgi:hypothetical protein